MYEFEFVRPASIADAVAALGADEAQALAGGQTLIPTLKARLAAPSVLVSLNGVADFRGISRDAEGRIAIRGGTTHEAVAAGVARDYPGLASLAARIGDPAVRARGTIGGSLANNDPSACYPAAVLGSGATVVTNTREIAADDFFDGMFTTVLEPEELITEVRFPVPQASNYQKFEQPASRFALVGVFVARFADHVRVAVTGASERGVFRWAEAEAALAEDFSAAAMRGLGTPGDSMIGDLHGSPAYRAHLVRVLTGRAADAAT